MPDKVVVVFGATGSQGRAVLQYFLRSRDTDNLVLKGITRNVKSDAARQLQSRGVEMVAADLDDVGSLKRALEGATHVLANTDSNQIIFQASQSPEMLQPGQTATEYAKEIELKYGENLRQALLATTSLVRVVWSSLTSPKKWSGGKYTKVTMFDAKEEIADAFVSEEALRSKLSILLVGFYADNAFNVPQLYAPQKQTDGSYKLAFPMPGDVPVPFADVENDIGKWVSALFQSPAGQILVGASDHHTWNEWIRLWAATNKVRALYEETSIEAFSANGPISVAVAEEFHFIGRYGFTGGNENVIETSDLAASGINVHGTKLKDYIQSCDWSSLL